MCKEFFLKHFRRPGILVLVNDADWELLVCMKYIWLYYQFSLLLYSFYIPAKRMESACLPLWGRHFEVRISVHLVSMGLHSVHLVGMGLGLGICGVKTPGWLSEEGVGLTTWRLWVRYPVEANFLSSVFLPLTSAEACEKSSRWHWKEICVSTGERKPGNTWASPTAMIWP